MEEDTEFEAGSRLQAVSTEPDAGIKLRNREIMTGAKGRCLTGWATQAPLPAIVSNGYFFKKNFFLHLFIYVWETERDRAQVGEGQREKETESKAGSRLQAVSTEPDVGLELTNREIMTWAKVGCLMD